MRISIDAKATVNLGAFSHDGYSRVPEAALDHECRDPHLGKWFVTISPDLLPG